MWLQVERGGMGSYEAKTWFLPRSWPTLMPFVLFLPHVWAFPADKSGYDSVGAENLSSKKAFDLPITTKQKAMGLGTALDSIYGV